MTVLRDGLLSGRSLAVAGDTSGGLGEALSGLGARIAQGDGDGAPPYALVYDARASFGSGGGDGLRVALEDVWETIREQAGGAMIAGGLPGKVVLIAPPPAAGPFATAARAALENLARTLSVEWARYGITAVALAPGGSTTDDQLAELVCFLVSDAGDYFSGCRFELGLMT